jgi:hypothetical protein
VNFGNRIGWIHYLPNERPMSELAPVPPPAAADSSISDIHKKINVRILLSEHRTNVSTVISTTIR